MPSALETCQIFRRWGNFLVYAPTVLEEVPMSKVFQDNMGLNEDIAKISEHF